MDSLEVTDQAAEAVAVAPRVKLEDIEAAIDRRFDILPNNLATAAHIAVDGYDKMSLAEKAQVITALNKLRVFSLCILVMKNGFIVVGKSAPASPENFNPELGKKFAYEDAIRQLWPLMGFSLRDRLAEKQA